METDAAELRPGSCLEAAVCIVGAGPAGLVLASALADRGVQVLLLESGSRRVEPELEPLGRVDVAGDPQGGLRVVRHRQVGGNAQLWNTRVRGRPGAKYVPLDPIDLEARPELALPGWPFGFDELEPWYRRAQAHCGLGRFAYDAQAWAEADRTPFALRGELLESRVYQLGTADVFLERAVERLARAPDSRVLTHATACLLEPDARGERAEAVRAVGPDGAELRVRAGRVVLAAGAIENARLLLLSAAASPRAGFDPHGQVGRGFMEHPRDRALRLVPARAGLVREAAFYDAWEAADGTALMGRLALREQALRLHGLPNASVTLLPAPDERPRSRVRRFLDRLGLARERPRSAPGWSQRDDGAPDGLELLVNLEQLPHPDHRVVLGAGRDALGLRRAEVHWHWRPEEQARLDRLHAVLAAELEASGLGIVVRRPGLAPDPNAQHHAGTARMSADPRCGAVDAAGRVHGIENLYVAGAAVLPSAGFANPMLTTVALALRMADHLADPETRGGDPGSA